MGQTKSTGYWLMKSEPDVFSFSDLLKAPAKTTFWEGVRNYQARNFMRDDFKVGDRVLYYHSNTEVPGIVGTATVVRGGYPDHTAMDPKAKYYDEDAAKKKVNPWVMVDIRADEAFAETISREQLAKEPKLKKMLVLQKGSRLSVQPVTEEEFVTVLSLARTK